MFTTRQYNRSLFMAVILAALVSLVLAGCDPQTSTSQAQENSRDGAMDRAHNAVSIPQTQNFLTRQTVAEFMRRIDEPDKVFYIYVMANTGNYIGYYVSQGRPVNICTFLSPPDRVDHSHSQGRVVRAAPGMDGVYYGGSACDSEYFFDAETDAMVEIVTRGGISMFVSEQPLELDVQQIRVSAE